MNPAGNLIKWHLEKDKAVSGNPVQVTKYSRQRKGSYRP